MIVQYQQQVTSLKDSMTELKRSHQRHVDNVVLRLKQEQYFQATTAARAKP